MMMIYLDLLGHIEDFFKVQSRWLIASCTDTRFM